MDNAAEWLSRQFWGELLQTSVRWAITAIPSIGVTLLLAFVLLSLLRATCNKLVARASASRADSEDAAHEQQKRAATLLGIVQKAGQIGIWCVVTMLVLMQFGVNVAPLIAGAGILGLAVGFGAQELVRDVITGFFVLLENQVRVGDVAVINGTGGLVESIGLRTIVLRDLSGVVHVFQNGKIQSLSNMTMGWSAMVFDVGVAYKESVDQVIEIMRSVADDLIKEPEFGAKILEPIEILGVDSFGDNAVVLKARLKTRPSEQWTIGREYRRRLKQAFDAHHIEIPFPHRTIYFGEANPPFRISASEKPAGVSAEVGTPRAGE